MRRFFKMPSKENVKPEGTPVVTEPAVTSTAVINDPKSVALLAESPDIGAPETTFPRIGRSKNTDDLQIFYHDVRKQISKSLDVDGFCGGYFKDAFAANCSVRYLINGLASSSRVSKEQRAVLNKFNRVWASAIYKSIRERVLDAAFIERCGLQHAWEDLVHIFEMENLEGSS
jgi:hypothetical protein